MYTPFIVIAGTVIDNEVNKNITISSGKMIDNGSKTIVFKVFAPCKISSLADCNFETLLYTSSILLRSFKSSSLSIIFGVTKLAIVSSLIKGKQQNSYQSLVILLIH